MSWQGESKPRVTLTDEMVDITESELMSMSNDERRARFGDELQRERWRLEAYYERWALGWAFVGFVLALLGSALGSVLLGMGLAFCIGQRMGARSDCEIARDLWEQARRKRSPY